MVTSPMDPDDAIATLSSQFGIDEDTLGKGAGGLVSIEVPEDVDNPFGRILYALDKMGWKVADIHESDGGPRKVFAEQITAEDATDVRTPTSNTAVRRTEP